MVGEAASGEEALRLAQELLPDIVLLDISMPGWDGLVTAERIATACPATAIVMLTVSEDQDKLLAAFKAGARAYVLKGVSAQELARVVRAAAAGEAYVSPSLASEMLVSLTRGRAPDPLQELTAREREILELIGTGLTNREIGAAALAVREDHQALRDQHPAEAAGAQPRRGRAVRVPPHRHRAVTRAECRRR